MPRKEEQPDSGLSDGDLAKRRTELEALIAQKAAEALVVQERMAPLEEELLRIQRQLSPLQGRVDTIKNAAELAKRDIRIIEEALQARERGRVGAEFAARYAHMLQEHVKQLGESTHPVARGLGRVLATVSQTEELRDRFPEVVGVDSIGALLDVHPRRIKVGTVIGECFIRPGINGDYLVGYHVRPAEPGEVKLSATEVYRLAAKDPYVREHSFGINDSFIGFGVDGITGSVAPVVLLQSRGGGREYRAVPQVRNQTSLLAERVGFILQHGRISIPQAQQQSRQ